MEKTKELVQILNENPDRELIFMYPDEGSDYAFTLGYPSRILIDEYVTIDERVWLKDNDGEELLNDMKDDLSYDIEDENEIDQKAEKQFNKLSWKKAIVVYIRP